MLQDTAQKPEAFSTFTNEGNAKIVFSAIPTFEFLVQKFSLPGVSTQNVPVPTRTGKFSRPGEYMEFEKPWVLEIIMDEQYIAYSEIFNWLNSYSSIEGFDVERDFEKIISDASIVVFDNNGRETMGYEFAAVYPLGLSSIEYSTTVSGYNYLKFNATFDYAYFKPVKPTNDVCGLTK